MTKAQRIKMLEDFANEKLALHPEAAGEYSFKWLGADTPKRRLGVCSFRGKYIGLSLRAVDYLDDDKLKDTILHEVAHVLAGHVGHFKHGATWKQFCRYLGAVPKAKYSLTEDDVARLLGADDSAGAKYYLKCNECGLKTVFYRKPRRQFQHYHCVDCRKSQFSLHSAGSGNVIRKYFV